MTSPLFATLFDFNVSPHMIAIVVPIAGMIFAGVMAIAGMYFSHQRKRLWHDTARLALEKGQPLPPALETQDRPSSRHHRHRERNDLRTGLILLAVSAGIYLFLRSVRAGEAANIAAIPGFIGIALLILGMFSAFTGPKSTDTNDHAGKL